MSDAPIGVFDSGVGGLTVLRALTEELPHESFLYLGDTARLPYGTKSADSVIRYAQRAMDALRKFDVKSIVVACNTAAAAALPAIQQHAKGIPVIGVVEPGAEAACAASESGHIAVIATEGTVQGGAYQAAIRKRRSDARISARATQLFVALAEEGLHDGPIAESVARHYLEPLLVAGGSDVPDTLVLACTHFPMLFNSIRKVAGPNVHIVDSAATTARAVREALSTARIGRASGSGNVRFFATDSPERFARVGSRFLGRLLSSDEVDVLDL